MTWNGNRIIKWMDLWPQNKNQPLGTFSQKGIMQCTSCNAKIPRPAPGPKLTTCGLPAMTSVTHQWPWLSHHPSNAVLLQCEPTKMDFFTSCLIFFREIVKIRWNLGIPDIFEITGLDLRDISILLPAQRNHFLTSFFPFSVLVLVLYYVLTSTI